MQWRHRTLLIATLVLSAGAPRGADATRTIVVAGRTVAVPAPRGLVDMFPPERTSAAERALLSRQKWKVVFGPAAGAVRGSRLVFDRSHVAMIVEGSWKSGQDRDHERGFRRYRDTAAQYARTWRTAFSDSVTRACAQPRAGRRPGHPTAPVAIKDLRLMRVGEDAVGWTGLGPDSRRPPVAGNAEIVVRGEMLVRGRRVGFVYGRTAVPACDEIDAVERDAREWVGATLAANR